MWSFRTDVTYWIDTFPYLTKIFTFTFNSIKLGVTIYQHNETVEKGESANTASLFPATFNYFVMDVIKNYNKPHCFIGTQ